MAESHSRLIMLEYLCVLSAWIFFRTFLECAMMNLTTRILCSRKDRKLSQQALADLIGVSRSALAQWETSMSRPSLDNLRKMAEILEVSFEWLATGRGNQYLSGSDDVISDSEVDGEIIGQLHRMNLMKKRAILNVMRAMA